jgi:hypothetical protein
MAGTDPNAEWIGNVQPIGLVFAATVLARHGLNPAEQTRADSETVRALLSPDDDGPALPDPWSFFTEILGWRAAHVAGAPGGPTLPGHLFVRVEESDTELSPHWAVTEPEMGWQILVRMERPGVAPEKRGALEGWEATPHQQMERLLRETGVQTGLLLTDGELRLIHAPHRETSGWLKFPLRSLGDVGGRPMLGGLKLILSSFRLHNDAPDRRLVALLKASRDAQAEVSTKLAAQVLGALHELLRGLHSADRARIEALAASRREHLYEGLLTVLLRLVFLLYAEDRDLIPSRTDGEARALYDQGYGVRSLYAHLLNDAAHHPDTMDERRGAWSRLLALFRLVHRGDPTGWIRGRGGKLFDSVAFPFLQGQETLADSPAPATVSDGCILRVLDLLLSLDGEKLSYRTLDVEQIGSVYETVMGFTVETRPGPALAIRAGKNDRTPVFVNVAALTAKKGTERAKFLKEEADRNSVSDKVGKALTAAADVAAVIAALRPIVDERGSPGGHVAPPGTPLLQPTDERRRTGSHYTPRSLTNPIVQHALAPAFARIGDDARPETVLDLKVCDPAMGSGAFLVEACRALGERLVQAWARWPETRPAIPADEDEHLHARRLVAQRSLYGVDKNPLATDLAKLSLWLATLARDHEFTFLDHALKSGDSLVGLTQAQIAAAHWDLSKPGLPLFRQLVKQRGAEAMKGRAEIQAAPDDTARAIQEARHRSLEARLKDIRLMGDAVIASFFGEDKPKARERKRAEVESWLTGSLEAAWDKLADMTATLKQGAHPLPPFHWEIEFPEVFAREKGGFDAIVGNPPFLGGSKITTELGMSYFAWLGITFEGSQNKCDLVGYFFRRAFDLLRPAGSLGLVATNTISQGDTREGSLAPILDAGGQIFRAEKRATWPGDASVVISTIHISKHNAIAQVWLNGRQTSRINAFLIQGDVDRSPFKLKSVLFFSQGSKIYGQGFVFDNHDVNASPLQLAEQLINKYPECVSRIRPYIGAEEINGSPTQDGKRLVIQLSDLKSERDLDDWQPLRDIVYQKVRPERLKLGPNPVNAPLKRRWWAYQAHRPELYSRLSSLKLTICVPRVTSHLSFVMCRTDRIFTEMVVCIASDDFGVLCCLQVRAHELFARFFSSTLGDALRYTASDCFQTFPFPSGFEISNALKSSGRAYHDHRAALMVEHNEGMTKTYNRFHDRTETSEDIQRLRELHAAMDRAVLEAYGWHDLAARAEPVFLDDTNEDDHTYQGRLFWPSDFRDEVLARLLALNAERHAEEVRLSIAPGMKGKSREDQGPEINEEVDA